ncbi:hypothetical protein RIF29_30237 [Crotalaria pallida]|uniref:Fe2OG dioxygenase domain-containing protein n=1 Tax=Crotalaria pallida TaxID=3830 RepID=A0AAN9EFZ4_CROPI
MTLEAEMEQTIFAPSIPVPSVQEIVKKDPLQVPEKYVRGHEEIEKDKHMPHLSSEIPVIDLALLSDGNEEELSKLDMACKEWGFFQLVNHGAEKEVLQKMKDTTSEFFKLPIEEKNKISMPSNDIHGYGHDHVIFEEQKLDWHDELVLITHPIESRKLSFWPKTPERFKEAIEAYTEEVKQVGEKLLRAMSVIMGMEKDALIKLHKELLVTLGLIYYPPCSTPEQVVGMSPHSDATTITILMQHDEVCGLEIRHKGDWVPVIPKPGALVVNVGDITEIWSNGKYKSIEHRGMTNKNKERTSYVFFLSPVDDVEVEPLDHFVDDQNVKLYQKVKFGDYLKESFKRKLEGKAHVDVAKIKQ